MSIAVVTDSTAYLPAGFAARYSVRAVPLHVSVNGADAVDEFGIGPDEVAAALQGKRRVTTSGATSAELSEVYRELLDGGADGVVSIHLSSQLSGTWDAARLAAREVDPDRVQVIDSRSTAMGMGFAVLAAASSAERGADLSEVAGRAALIAERTTTLFSVPTLEYLRRGGRIGTAAAVLGTALAIKPLLHVREGRIEALEKVRTTARAMARLLEITSTVAASGPVSVAVHHLAAPEQAERLAEQIRSRVAGGQDCSVSEVGAVIGAHIGPGTVGVVILPGGWKEIESV